MLPPPRTPLEANLRWAFGWTFKAAAGFSAYVAALALAQRSTWFPKYGVSLWMIILGYFAGAFFAGVALGFLRPLGTTRFGAYLLGGIVGYMVYASVGLLVVPGIDALWMATIPALATGGLGVVFYDDPSAGSSYSPTVLKSRMIVYGILLALAIVLLWLDMSHHLINK